MAFWAAAFAVAKWIFAGKGFWPWLTRAILTTAAMFGLGKLLSRSGGAKAEDIYVQGQGYGSPVKRVWGTMRIAGNLLWVWSKGIVCNKNKSHPNNYYARFAIQICEGPIVGVKKIWFGPKLVFDDESFKGTIERDTDKISLEIWNCPTLDNRDIGIVRIYLGTETQTADSAMETDLGAGQVPAYRGYAYAVFEGSSLGANLDVFGGQIPPITFEVVADGAATSGDWTTVAVLPAVRSDPAVANWNGHIYVVGGNDGAAKLATGLVYQASDAWTDLKAGSSAPTWTARDGIAASAASFGVLLYGGDSGVAALATAFMLSEDGIRAVAQTGTGPGARKDAACVVVQSTTPTVFLSGGHDGTNPKQDCYLGLVSKAGIRWGKKNTACGHGTRTGHTLLEFGGTVYCIGGTCTSAPTKSNACYSLNQTTLAFTELVADLTGGAEAAGTVWAATVCNGVLVALVNGATKLRLFQSADGTTWTEIAFTETIARYTERPAMVNFEGELFLVGGSIAASAVTTVRRYHGWSCITRSTTLTVGDVVGDLLAEAGLSTWEYDVSALTDTIHGYALSDVTTIREAIEDLQAAYLFDLAQNDWRLVAVKRGGATAATLDEDYLAAHTAGSECPDRLVYVRVRETELPTELRFGYVDKDRTYEPNVQTAQRILDHNTTVADISVPIAMSADEAATAATRLLYSAWANRGEAEFTVSFRYLKLIPSDVISVTVDSIAYKIRIEKMDFSTDGLLKIAGAVEDVDIYTVTATGTAAQAQTAKPFYPPHLVLVDTIHLAGLAEPWPGIWAVATPAGDMEGWRGAWLWISKDGGTTYQKVGEFSTPCAVGTALNAIAAPTVYGVWDEARYVDVQLINDFVPTSPGDQAVLNAAAGSWRAGDENIAASTVTSLGSNQYRLSRLIRARYGSEGAADDHVIGERVVCLDSAIFVPLEMSDYNATLLFKLSAPGVDHLDDIPPIAHTYEGENYLIPSPVAVTAVRDSVDNVAINWKRRNRIGGDLVDGQDIPLGEDGEVYEIDVYNGGTVVRTIRAEAAGGGPLAMPEITYTADEQITDFGAVQSSISLKMYQVGKVGRGREATATI